MEQYENWDLKKLGWKGFVKQLYNHHKPDGGALLLRLVLGYLFLVAGWWKVTHMAMTVGFFATMGFGPFAAHMVGWVELIAGILLILGILTKPTCVALATQMAVIVWGTDATPSVAYFGHDYNFVLLVTFLALYLIGPGKYSLAQALWKKSKLGC